MKLTELLACTAILAVTAAVLFESLADFTRNRRSVLAAAKKAQVLLEKDSILREKIRNISFPYWKNSDKIFAAESEKFLLREKKSGTEILSVKKISHRNHESEEIEVEWQYDGKLYVTREYIRQRIIND